MTYAKPAFRHPDARTNEVGCTRRDYEGDSPPYALAVATTRSVPPLSTPALNCPLSPIEWRSSQASAVRPKPPPTF
jgi:hypothetical protein